MNATTTNTKEDILFFVQESRTTKTTSMRIMMMRAIKLVCLLLITFSSRSSYAFTTTAQTKITSVIIPRTRRTTSMGTLRNRLTTNAPDSSLSNIQSKKCTQNDDSCYDDDRILTPLIPSLTMLTTFSIVVVAIASFSQENALAIAADAAPAGNAISSTVASSDTTQLVEGGTQKFKFGEFIVYAYIGLSALAGVKGVYDTAQ